MHGIRVLVCRSKDNFYYVGLGNGIQVLRPSDWRITHMPSHLSSPHVSSLALKYCTVCSGLDENDPHRSTESGLFRRCGLVGVAVALLEEDCH